MNVSLQICTIFFILLFLIDGSNQHRLGTFVILSLGIFIVIILIRIWFINYPPYQIIILRGVLDEVDEILSELPGDKGVSINVLLPHGMLADDHSPPITYFFPLNIARVDGIGDNIIIILELDDPILLQELDFALLIIFIGGGGLPIFLNIGTEFYHWSRLPISIRLISRLPKVFLKIIPSIDRIPLVTPFRDLGISVDNGLFLWTFKFGTDPLACTQRGK